MGGTPRPVADRHVVEFYETDVFLVRSVADFVGPALAEGEGALVVATPEHRSALEAALREAGLDLEEAAAVGRYVARDAAEVLATFMREGTPDAGLFRTHVGGILEELTREGRPLRVYGEMVALLWGGGEAAAAVTLEKLWNDLAERHRFSLLCGYPLGVFEHHGDVQTFRQMCDEHATVVPSESYSLLTAREQRLAVAILQQELVSLKREVTRLSEGHRALEHLAFLDPLTGLANRRSFLRDLEREWGNATRRAGASVVVVADLDGLKACNDTAGHAAGDRALVWFADALRAVTRRGDSLGRLGGDEFGVVLVGAGPEGAARFAERLRAVMAATAGDHVSLTASLGTTLLAEHASPAEALRRADLLMLEAKRRGRAGGRRAPAGP